MPTTAIGPRGGPVTIRLDSGWKRFKRALDVTGFQGAMKKHVRRATELNAKLAQRAVRQSIKSGNFEKNAALTIAIKGSSKPLVDKGSGLFQAITTKVIKWDTAFVGVLQTDEHYNIAEGLHNGVSIGVTDAMRAMFWYLWKASTGEIDPGQLTGRAAELWDRRPGIWLPLRDSTKVITIPKRPFFERAFDSPELKAMVKANWERAVQAAIRETAKK